MTFCEIIEMSKEINNDKLPFILYKCSFENEPITKYLTVSQCHMIYMIYHRKKILAEAEYGD